MHSHVWFLSLSHGTTSLIPFVLKFVDLYNTSEWCTLYSKMLFFHIVS